MKGIQKELICISGVNPGPTGTGRLLEYLQEQSLSQKKKVRFIFGSHGLPSWRLQLSSGQYVEALIAMYKKVYGIISMRLLGHRKFLETTSLVLFHFQSIGFDRVEKIIQNAKGMVWIYFVDNNFFCLQSYDHRDGMMDACLDCLGNASLGAIKHGCRSRPFYEVHAKEFLEKLSHWIHIGKVGALVQSESHLRLARAHFGESAEIHVAGCWMSDWESDIAQQEVLEAEYDVVFHGSQDSAKGYEWVLRLAKLLPHRTFLFPFTKPVAMNVEMPNVTFKPMSWRTGLERACRSARIVLAPSLWSATVEGALIKSLQYSQAVGVVELGYCFSSELPAEIVLKLPLKIEEAAQRLDQALGSSWGPDRNMLKSWMLDFSKRNRSILDFIQSVCLR